MGRANGKARDDRKWEAQWGRENGRKTVGER